MAILNNSNAITTTGGYDVNNSLRFRSSASAYLNRTPASAGSRTTWTWSAWIKRGVLTNRQDFFGVDNSNVIAFSSGDNLNFELYNGPGASYYILTTAVYRDPSAWYHIVAVWDSNNATATERQRLFVNGQRITAFTSANTIPSGALSSINSATNTSIGRNTSGGFHFDGYIADLNFIDGQALTPSSFGETDTTTGVWKPKAYTGTYGTNGFYLKFSDIATTSGSNAGLGKDFSGNTNYWTTNNISVTSGTTYDAMTDSPTNTSATVGNYAVLNPLDTGIAPTNANLSLPSSGFVANRATIQIPTSGKWYFESTVTTATGSSFAAHIGLCTSSASLTTYSWNTTGTYGIYWTTAGNIVTNGSYGIAAAGALSAGAVLQCAYDADTGKLYIGVNNTWYTSAGGTSGNPSAGTGETLTVASSTSLFPYIQAYANLMHSNFGQRPFAYTPPTGFVALNTYNLPTPTILQGNTVMDATLWTGNGASSRSITNAASFRPDFVWIKSRSNAFWHQLYDAVRGVQQALYSNSTNAELTETTGLTAFNSNGFTVSSGSGVNENASTFVGWQWQAGSSTVTNTSGSISSQVRANTTAGFSIVTYTGTGSTATVGHGLGVAPRMVIVKSRSAGSTDWVVYHASLGATQNVRLQSTAAAATQTVMWNDTAPTSTVFTIGTNNNVNTNAQTQVAYCWAEIAGFSRFGSYTGNGSTDGPFVYLGFRPKFIMIKVTTTTNDWYIYDTSRNTSNLTNLVLFANLSDAQATATVAVLDILSNGFKIRGSASINAAQTYIYMAFAENPFKNSLAR